MENEEIANQSYRQYARVYQWEVALVRNRTELVDNPQLLRECPTRNTEKASCFSNAVEQTDRNDCVVWERLLSDPPGITWILKSKEINIE
jgi:uncharacterized Fe-S cluster-containing protein